MKPFLYRLAGKALFLVGLFAFITLNFAFLSSIDAGMTVMSQWAGTVAFCWPAGLVLGLPLLVALMRENDVEPLVLRQAPGRY